MWENVIKSSLSLFLLFSRLIVKLHFQASLEINRGQVTEFWCKEFRQKCFLPYPSPAHKRFHTISLATLFPCLLANEEKKTQWCQDPGVTRLPKKKLESMSVHQPAPDQDRGKKQTLLKLIHWGWGDACYILRLRYQTQSSEWSVCVSNAALSLAWRNPNLKSRLILCL